MRLAPAVALVLLSFPLIAGPARAQALSPDGDGCEGVIGRWQAFATQENQGGHMDQSVYDKIETEIAQATDVCRAGRDGEALRLVEASKRRHGY